MPRGKVPANGKGAKPKPSQNSENNPNLKPLSGRLFYLDITSRSVTDKLEKDIRALGGTVEGFLSKEISILITSKKEAKCKKSMKYSCLSSPEPALNPGSSAQPGSCQGGPQEGGSKKKQEKADVSRGKSLLKKAMKEQESVPRNCVLACAWNWGVRVLHVDDAKVYLEAKKKLVLQHTRGAEKRVQPAKSKLRKPKPQKLKTPFIKVEDYFEQYKPFYLEPPLFQSFQMVQTKKADDDKASGTRQSAAATKSGTKQSAATKSGTRQGLNNTGHGQDVNDLNGNTWHGQDVNGKTAKKQGYCECCLKYFYVLEDHLASQMHQNFSRSALYHEVDSLIAMFEFNFVDWSKQRQEPRSSLSNSIALPTGPIDWKGVTTDKFRQNSPKIAYVKPTFDVRRIDPALVMNPPGWNMQIPDPRNMQIPDPWAYPFLPGGQGASSNGYHPSLPIPGGTPIFPPYADLPPLLPPLPPSPPRIGISRNFAGETRTASVTGVRSPAQALQEPNLGPSVDALLDPLPAPLINSLPSPLSPLSNSSSESEDASPTKRMKVSGSLVPVSLFSNHVDAGQATSHKSVIDTLHRNTEPAFLSIHEQSGQSSPSKLQRKVKLPPPRRGKPEEPSTSTALRAEPSTSSWKVEPSTSSAWKMSVPAENCEWQASRERLLSLFETSEAQSDFCGFSSRSEILHPMDDNEEPSTRDDGEEPHIADGNEEPPARDDGEEPSTRDNEEPPNTDDGSEPLPCRSDFQWLAPSESSDDTFHGF